MKVIELDHATLVVGDRKSLSTPALRLSRANLSACFNSSVARALKTQNQNARDRNPIVYFQDFERTILDVQNAPRSQ